MTVPDIVLLSLLVACVVTIVAMRVQRHVERAVRRATEATATPVAAYRDGDDDDLIDTLKIQIAERETRKAADLATMIPLNPEDPGFAEQQNLSRGAAPGSPAMIEWLRDGRLKQFAGTTWYEETMRAALKSCQVWPDARAEIKEYDKLHGLETDAWARRRGDVVRVKPSFGPVFELGAREARCVAAQLLRGADEIRPPVDA
jgi:hypothetical protein